MHDASPLATLEAIRRTMRKNVPHLQEDFLKGQVFIRLVMIRVQDLEHAPPARPAGSGREKLATLETSAEVCSSRQPEIMRTVAGIISSARASISADMVILSLHSCLFSRLPCARKKSLSSSTSKPVLFCLRIFLTVIAC